MTIDLDQITPPLRLTAGMHQPGDDDVCAMEFVSRINGDTEITDYPECSAQPLAKMVQICNDELADHDGYLSPEHSVTVLELGWQTVGTADVDDSVIHAWIAELLDSDWGVIRFANDTVAIAIRSIADLHRRTAKGEEVDRPAWSAVRSAAAAAPADCYADWRAADSGTWSTVNSTESASWHAAMYAAASAIASAPTSGSLVEFTAAAIAAWRRLGNLDMPTELTTDAVNGAMGRIG